MTAKAIDYIGMWYVARARLGINDDIEFVFLHPETGQTTRVDLLHRDHDGIGGVLTALRKVGVSDPKTPAVVRRSPPPFWQRWKRPIQPPNTHQPEWKALGESSDNALHRHVLSRTQTQQLLLHAKQQAVSLNSLLLLALHRAVCATLLQNTHTGSWCFPVNMRHALSSPREEMNMTSGFYLTVMKNDHAKEVDALIKANLKNNAHWRYWHLARMGRWIGQIGVNVLCRLLTKQSAHLGSLSNLGEWDVDFESAAMHRETAMACCGPGSPSHPVANGVMIVNGKMSFTLKLHASLGASDDVARRCLARWLEELEELSCRFL